MEKIRVLIADDHPIVRQGLKGILADEPDMAVVSEAGDSREVLALVDRNIYDIVVLDITMPGRGGLEVLKDIKERRPALPVLILSMHPEEHYGIRALKAGASGYLTKKSAPEKLVEALRKIVSGRKYISSELAEKLVYAADRNAKEISHETLSDREYQVMCMIASGKSVSEIARDLSLSVKTISSHRLRILKKMDLRSNAELTHYAVKSQLV